MTPELWLRVSRALDEATELAVEDRAVYLDRLRADDAEAAAEVASLLQERPATLDKMHARLLAAVDTATGADAADITQAEDWPTRIGPYEVQAEVARGGMGVVLRAWDPKFQRLLAIKILDQKHAGDESLCRRFQEEAQIMGQLQHPGIPPVYDMGAADGRPFLAMKLIQGQTFEKLLQNDTADLPRYLGIFAQICQTMGYAHTRGILHRDLKPANIMVGKFGEVQVMDWGLVKILERNTATPTTATSTTRIQVLRQNPLEPTKTMAGSVMGTLAYMSPEQAHADEFVDERVDVFGLGAILCEILTGKPAYIGSTATELLRKAMTADLSDALRRLDASGADPELVQLARRCLDPELSQRLANAGEVARCVADYLQSVQSRLQQAKLEQAQAVARAEEEQKRRRVELQKQRILFALVASLLVLMLGAATVGIWFSQHQLKLAQTEADRRADLLKRVEQCTMALDEEQRSAQQLASRLADYRKVQDLANDLTGWETQVQRRADALRRAEAYLNTNERLDANVEERLLRQQLALEADQQTLAVAKELDAIQLESFMSLEVRWNPTAAGPKYAQFFRRQLRFDAENADEAQAAAVIAKSPARHILVAALDHWAELSQHPESAYKHLLPKLLKIARLVDADDWRDRFRDPAVWQDAHRLALLAAEVKSTEQSAQLLMALAAQLDRVGGKGVAVAQSALVHYPRSFWLYLTTANLLKDPAEKAGYCQAALAVRPDNPVATNNLAMALYLHKKMTPAVELFEKLVRLFPASSSVSNQLGVTNAGHAKLLMQQGRFTDARHKFHLALKRLPEDDIAPITEQLRECDRCLAVQQSEAQRPLAAADIPATIAGKLLALDPSDFFPHAKRARSMQPVRLAKGKTYQIDLESPDFDSVLRIENAKWQALMSNDDFGPMGKLPPETNSRLLFTPAEDGLFRLVVTAIGDKSGDYTLTLRETAPAGNVKKVNAELRTSDERTAEGKYSQKHDICFEAGKCYVIELESPSFDTYLKLQDLDGKLLSWNDDITTDNRLKSRIDFTPQQTASYVLLVTSYHLGEVGNYTLTIDSYTPAK